MAKIKYGVYPNPLPDAEGNTTYLGLNDYRAKKWLHELPFVVLLRNGEVVQKQTFHIVQHIVLLVVMLHLCLVFFGKPVG